MSVTDGLLDRLSPQDVSNLRIEGRGLPMHVAGLAILDGAALCDPQGEIRLKTLRAEVERRLHLAPRLRQVLYHPPLGLGPPLWVDDPAFEIAEHVRARRVSSPGDENALLDACVELNEGPLDRSRPLWELWFLTGLSGGKVAMLIRLHHVVADGIASVALLGSLFDLVPDAASPRAPVWIPAPPPSSWELLVDNLRRRGSGLIRAVSGLAHPVRGLRHLRSSARALKEVFREGLAPRTSLNTRVGRRRRLLLARADLERVKTVAHAHGAKVNDVVLAAVAGGVRELLRGRGELMPGLEVRASVPVSFRGSMDRPDQGNLVALMIVPLPVGEPDHVRCLESIAAETRQRKRLTHVVGPLPGSLLVQRALIGLMKRQRIVNLFTSNVPGPPIPLYFAGARVLELFQIGIVQGNVALSLGVISYAGQLNFDIVGDPDALADLDVFADGMSKALVGLEAKHHTDEQEGDAPLLGVSEGITG